MIGTNIMTVYVSDIPMGVVMTSSTHDYKNEIACKCAVLLVTKLHKCKNIINIVIPDFRAFRSM